ncbi:hypothetical protein X534_gp14 [Ralstonia phage RSB3]|uniref:Uncharacterized protein n=1 Tax=Ralstonia phage RSB3 TaxID=1402875 RepID=U3TJY6_9CAUD|nr:hypothetical protein X534_gp14 [Ralstonia phage RSB3]BAN92325.1 hypothetical protein [Ralstonia phage RSB3]
MKTFSIDISIKGKVTVPETIIRDLRIQATDGPENGGDRFLHELSKQTQGDDDAFVQAALRNALRNIVRNGVINDIGGMGVGVKAAPATVTVSVPERIVTKVKAREQVAVERLDVRSYGEEGSLEQADA